VIFFSRATLVVGQSNLFARHVYVPANLTFRRTDKSKFASGENIIGIVFAWTAFSHKIKRRGRERAEKMSSDNETVMMGSEEDAGGWKGTKSIRLVVLGFHNNSAALGEEEEGGARERSARRTRVGQQEVGRIRNLSLSLSLSFPRDEGSGKTLSVSTFVN